MRAPGFALVALAGATAVGACGGNADETASTGGTAGTGGVDSGVGGMGGFEATTCPTDQKQCSTGCESKSDPATGCGSTTCASCNLPHATATCDSQATCAVGACDAGWADCNANPIDGCETDLEGDKYHCGSCANDCVAQHGPGWSCQGGKCYTTCCGPSPEWKDCDGLPSNCCETNTATDPQNCGTCGNVCASGQACVSSKCQ